MRDRIQDERIRDTTKMEEISKKIQQRKKEGKSPM